jgi:hypothetical protein
MIDALILIAVVVLILAVVMLAVMIYGGIKMVRGPRIEVGRRFTLEQKTYEVISVGYPTPEGQLREILVKVK